MCNMLLGVSTWFSLATLATSVSVWPQPASLQLPGGYVVVGQKFDFVGAGAALRPACDRTLKRMFRFGRTARATAGSLDSCAVNVADPGKLVPQLGQDESYELSVTATSCTLTARSVFGLYHGLQTLVQLAEYSFANDTYALPLVNVADKPAFAHRGVMIDSGRHFLPVPVLLRLLDGMAAAKFNVLHWHLTEDQSWPLASRVYPEFAARGSYSPWERYSIENLKSVVQHAAGLGIRVIPEFDMPGHTTSWRMSHPELFTSNCQSAGSRGALDPANPKVYEVVKSLIGDWYDGVFNDTFVHVGTDEVPTGCWNNKEDVAFMKAHGIKDFNGLFAYFIRNLTQVTDSLGRRAIMWDEAFTSGNAPKSATIQIWHDASLLKQIVQTGHQAIFSPNGGYTKGWYLDGLKATWQAMYELNPMDGVDTKYRSLVLGGEGCMWGETVDASDLEMTIWPRAAAIAERLWSDPPASANATAAAQPRLESFRCFLLQLGHAAGLVGGGGRVPPPGPGQCSQAGSHVVVQSPLYS